MYAALALLCALDPEGFEIAFLAVPPDPAVDAGLEEPVAACGLCGSMVALYPEDLTWRHYRGPGVISGVRRVFDAGHEPGGRVVPAGGDLRGTARLAGPWPAVLVLAGGGTRRLRAGRFPGGISPCNGCRARRRGRQACAICGD